MTRLLRVLLPEELGGLNHVLQTCLRFVPSSRLQTAVGVDPQLVWLEVLKHLLKTVLDLLLAWNTRAVDVVNTWTNMAWISLGNEDLEKLGIRLAVLDGQDIGIESGDGVQEVLELRVTEVRVDLGAVLYTSGRQLEAVAGPSEVFLA